MNTNTNFKDDYKKGDSGVDIFTKYILKNQSYEFSNSSNKEDYDIKAGNGIKYEIKCNYKDDNKIIIEEWYDMKNKKPGWIKTSKSDFIVFISAKSKTCVFYQFRQLQRWYDNNIKFIEQNFGLKINNQTVGIYGDKWYSSYRRINMDYISVLPLTITL